MSGRSGERGDDVVASEEERDDGGQVSSREVRDGGDRRDTRDESEEPEAKKGYREILAEEIHEASRELHRPRTGLVMSALSAGLDVGFSLLAVAVVVALFNGETDGVAPRLLIAAAYSIGYIFVVIGRSELFTEHTTLAVLPVLNGDARLSRLARLWAIVYAGNIVGVTLFALLAGALGPGLHIFEVDDLEHIARGIVEHDGYMIGLSAVLAGWLMGLLSWLVTAARETIAQIVIVFMITGLIGLSHLHHCIVGACEVIAAIVAGGDISGADFLKFLAWATLGNAVGGVIFVAVVKFGHASRPSNHD